MDYLNPASLEKANRKNGGIIIPKSDVLQFFTADGTKISIRPSGTEPKIKFYFGVRDTLKNVEDYEKVNQALDSKIDSIIKELKLR
jgi:phosphoglucomutase